MAALYSFLFIVFISVIIIRIGATAYELTGLSADVSAFQAQSAFSGVGFTTEEKGRRGDEGHHEKVHQETRRLQMTGITGGYDE